MSSVKDVRVGDVWKIPDMDPTTLASWRVLECDATVAIVENLEHGRRVSVFVGSLVNHWTLASRLDGLTSVSSDTSPRREWFGTWSEPRREFFNAMAEKPPLDLTKEYQTLGGLEVRGLWSDGQEIYGWVGRTGHPFSEATWYLDGAYYRDPASPDINDLVLKAAEPSTRLCDCGAEKVKTTHAGWCSTGAGK